MSEETKETETTEKIGEMIEAAGAISGEAEDSIEIPSVEDDDTQVKFVPQYSKTKMELADQTMKAKLSKWAFLTALTGTVLTVGMMLLLATVRLPLLYAAAHVIVPVGLTLIGVSVGLLIVSFDVPSAVRKPGLIIGVLGWLAFCFSSVFTNDPRIQWGLFIVAIAGFVLGLAANGKSTPESKENLVELFGLDEEPEESEESETDGE